MDNQGPSRMQRRQDRRGRGRLDNRDNGNYRDNGSYRDSEDYQNDGRYDDRYNDPQRDDDRNYKKRNHRGRWIALIVVVLIFLGGTMYIGHQLHELADAQRQTNTILDKPVKQATIKLVGDKLPSNVRPQIVKLINDVPLAELQRAANDPQLFEQVANRSQIPAADTNAVASYWFSNANDQLRSDLYHGRIIDLVGRALGMN